MVFKQSGDPPNDGSASRPWQFSLIGLMAVTAACAVALTTVRHLGLTFVFLIVTAIAWIVLGAVCAWDAIRGRLHGYLTGIFLGLISWIFAGLVLYAAYLEIKS